MTSSSNFGIGGYYLGNPRYSWSMFHLFYKCEDLSPFCLNFGPIKSHVASITILNGLSKVKEVQYIHTYLSTH